MWREVNILFTGTTGWCLATLVCSVKTGSFNHKEHEKEKKCGKKQQDQSYKGEVGEGKDGGGQRTRPCHPSSNLVLCKLIVLSNSLTIDYKLV